VLYLVFNEGYASSGGDHVYRVDLSSGAIRVTRLLAKLLPDEPEVNGLLALMLLTDARRSARSGPSGELIPLDEQDRSRWDRAERGNRSLNLVRTRRARSQRALEDPVAFLDRYTTRLRVPTPPIGFRFSSCMTCCFDSTTTRWFA
jgi:predicted RNA polymerase sigma factor